MSKRSTPERDFQKRVVKLAQDGGWLIAHFTPARRGGGGTTRWMTPALADGAGFPDLVLVRDRIVFAEIKADAGRIAPAQHRWIAALEDVAYPGGRGAGGPVDVYVWRPRDWDTIERVLA